MLRVSYLALLWVLLLKICKGCRTNKPFSDYYPAANKADGYNIYCKQCCKVNRALEAVRKRDKKSKISVRQIQRAKGLGVKWHSDITLVGVFKKYRGMCHLCHLWVVPKQASLDHILPFSKGGDHTHDNVGLSHLKCNLRKGNRI